jgi:hypothetical protein
MNQLLRFSGHLLAPLLLAASVASAQQLPVLPLPAAPGRKAPAALQGSAQARSTTVVNLPFFDDFTSPLEGQPSTAHWLPGGGVLVNNRLAVNPPTRGTATFDGLKANGNSYSNTVTNIFTNIDSLVSQPINLAGLTVADSVYLSFAWQAGSIIGAPTASGSNTPVNLNLQFKSIVGTNDRWTNAPGWLIGPAFVGRSTGQRTPFRQVIIPINQAQYLHGTFQFRFLATGNSSYAGDTWSVDYVVVDRSRGPHMPSAQPDTTFADIATSAGLQGTSNPSGGLRSPLRRYTAMPVWQFNAASPPSSELNPRLGVNITNLNGGALPLPITWQGTVRELTSGANLGTWLSGGANVTTNPRLNVVRGDASQLPIPATPAAKNLRYTLALRTQETTPRTLANDTIFRDVALSNYYAYDDGTPEALTQLLGLSTGPPSYLAYQFDLNQPDQVYALRLYPIFTASDRSSRPVTINVWDDDNGRPAATPRATKLATIPNPLPAGTQYYEIAFDTPVPVTGTFYVGFGQASQGRDLQYALDLNSTIPARHFWNNTAGRWDTTYTIPRGALMMRPVMNNNIVSATATARDAAAFALYPNPAHGTVTVAGPAFAHATVLDALGRAVWEQPAGQAGRRELALGTLPPGVYVVRLALPDGSTATRRLLLE